MRFDPELADRKAHYPDGALATFAMTLCFAEQQPQRGVFKRAVLKALLEKRARWIPFLLLHGDLEELADGKLYMVGWNEWQEGDWKVHERVQRIRARRNGTVGTVTTPTVMTVITPSEQQAVGGRQQATSGRQDEGVKPPGRLRRFVMPRRGFKGGEMTPLSVSLPKVSS